MEAAPKAPDAPKKGLGLYALTMLATGQVIGAGVVTLVGASIAHTGRSAWLAYASAVLLGFCIILSYMILSSMIRVKGGNYTFVATLLGDRWGGLYGMAFTMNVFACGMFALSLGQYLNMIFPSLPIRTTAIVAVTFFYIFNMLGVNFMSKIQNVLSAMLIIGLLVFVAVGMGQLQPGTFDSLRSDFFLNGSSGFLAAVALLVFSCYGHAFVVAFSKEANHPRRDIPYAMMITTGIILVVYTLIALVDSNILPVPEVAGKPLTVVARQIMPEPLYYTFVIGGPVMALATTLNSSLSVFARPFHQMTRDGWFPTWLARTNRYGAPFYILTLMYLIAVIPIALNLSISVITSNTVLIGRISDLVAIAAVLTLPSRLPDAWENRYFRMSKGTFYFLIGLSLVATVFYIYISMGNMPRSNVAVTVGLAIVFLLYSIYRQRCGKVKMEKSYELQ
ncbi:MAG: APC family permease [Planctomycetaceae bacterium]|nr:APC family permease [Planctomycetaceae bacterium]